MSQSAMMAGLDSRTGLRVRPRSRFFLVMAIVCTILLLAGFSRTFFLKTMFETPALPAYVHIHGWIWTVWFGFFVTQTYLIDSRRVSVHRRLGIAGAALALLMTCYGLLVLYLRIVKYHSPERDLDLGFTTTLVWGNLNLLAAFAVFVSLGIIFRHRAEAHKRLMLLATFSMMGQPLARLSRIEVFKVSESQMVNEMVYGFGGFIALFLTLIVYDLVTRGRPHPASVIGAPLMIVSVFLSATVIPKSSIGQGLVLMFG